MLPSEPFFLRVPFLHVQAITLWCVVLYTEPLTPELRRHETIHYLQYNELWVLGFLAVYVGDFLRNYREHDFWEAYRRIRLEREAYANEDDPEYLESREPYAWRAYAL